MSVIAASLFLYLRYLVAEHFLGSPAQEPAGIIIYIFISPRRQQHTSTYRHKLKTIKERTHRTQSKKQLRERTEHNKHKQIKTNTGKDTEDAVYLK